MSIKAIAWAWQQEVKPSEKFVLMAIADSADDFGEAKVSQSFLAWKTEFSERFVRKAIVELESAGLMSRVRTSRRDGTRGVDGVVLHLEKVSSKAPWTGLSEVRRQLNQQLEEQGLPAGKDFGPDITAESVSDETPSQNHRNNVPVVDRRPVDKHISPCGNYRNVVPVDSDYRNVVPDLPEHGSGSDLRGHLPTTRAPVFYPSSSSVGADAPVDNDDDDETTTNEQQRPRVARTHQGVNLGRLAVECSTAAGTWSEPVWVAAVDLILGRAKSRVGRPQAYVTGSITNEPAVMLDAVEVVAEADEALGQSLWAGTGPGAPTPSNVHPPARRVTCPIHGTDHREDRICGGCRADRLAQHPKEG